MSGAPGTRLGERGGIKHEASEEVGKKVAVADEGCYRTVVLARVRILILRDDSHLDGPAARWGERVRHGIL
jgi:hypothetical protein